jgi:hypothetical protein
VFMGMLLANFHSAAEDSSVYRPGRLSWPHETR